MNTSVIDLELQRRARLAKPVRLLPDLDGYSCLLDFGLGGERHDVLAWALLEDQSVSAMVLLNATLTPVTQLGRRFGGYCDGQLEHINTDPPGFVLPSLMAARDHFDPPHSMQCPDMADLSVAFCHDDQWSFKPLQMWSLKNGDVAPLVDYQTRTAQGPRCIRIDSRRYSSFAGLVSAAQIGQLKAGGPVGMDFFGLLPGYRT